jgi:hypothetical protein
MSFAGPDYDIEERLKWVRLGLEGLKRRMGHVKDHFEGRLA